MAPADDRLALLLRTLREESSTASPVWTDTNESDPGVTLLSLFAYLAEQLGSRSAELPAEARAQVARIGRQLASLDPDEAPVSVYVDGERWQAVSELASAAPDAAVFTLDPADGSIRFGDGLLGRRPAEGSRVSATFRTGGGASAGQAPTPLTPPQLERPNYFSGRLLTADDLALEQAYVREKFRRLHQASFDTGIVAGLQVTVDSTAGAATIVVSRGSALDPHGELIVLDADVRCPVPPLTGDGLVLLRYLERASAFSPARPEVSGDGSAVSRPLRIAEGAAISIADSMDEGAVLLATLIRGDEGWSVAAAVAAPE